MRIILWMIVGVLLNAVILEILEYNSQKKFMNCVYYQLRTKQPYNMCKEYLKISYPDRPYLSECLYPPGNKSCKTFGVEFMEFK